MLDIIFFCALSKINLFIYKIYEKMKLVSTYLSMNLVFKALVIVAKMLHNFDEI